MYNDTHNNLFLSLMLLSQHLRLLFKSFNSVKCLVNHDNVAASLVYFKNKFLQIVLWFQLPFHPRIERLNIFLRNTKALSEMTHFSLANHFIQSTRCPFCVLLPSKNSFNHKRFIHLCFAWLHRHFDNICQRCTPTSTH